MAIVPLAISNLSAFDSDARRYERCYQQVLEQQSFLLSRGIRDDEAESLFDGAQEGFLIDFAGYVYLKHGDNALRLILTLYPFCVRRVVELEFFEGQRIFQPKFFDITNPNLTEEDIYHEVHGSYESKH